MILSKMILITAGVMNFSLWAGTSFIKIKSKNTVASTIDKLEGKLRKGGMTIFDRISHSEGAKKRGLNLRDTELLIFGNPKIGAKLMNCDQRVGIDLPLKMLSWKDKNGDVWLGYNEPEQFFKKYKIETCSGNILKKVSKKLNDLAVFSTE